MFDTTTTSTVDTLNTALVAAPAQSAPTLLTKDEVDAIGGGWVPLALLAGLLVGGAIAYVFHE